MSGPQQALIGGGMKPVNISGHTISGQDFEAVNPSTATATYTLNSSGAAQATTVGDASNPPQGTTSYNGEWMLVPPNSAYEARATLTSGSIDTGTLNTWLALSTTRSWTVTVTAGAGSGNVNQQASLLIEIRDASTLLVLDSDDINLEADANSG